MESGLATRSDPVATIATSVSADMESAVEARLSVEVARHMALIPAMMHSIDESGHLISVSDAWLAKLGYQRDEVLGRLSSGFLTPESRKYAIDEVLPAFFRDGKIENIRYGMVKKCGAVIDVLMSAVLTQNPSGHGRISLAVLTDVTALLETRRLLQDSESRYRSLVEDQSDVVFLATPDGKLQYVNGACSTYFQRTAEALIGMNLLDFVPESHRAGTAEHLRKVCAAREKIESKSQIVAPDGARRWFAWTNRALRDAEGCVTAIHTVGRDIQVHVDAERRLQASEARYRFLAEHSTDLILLVGQDGQRLYASPASRKLLGYEPEEAVALRLKDAIHPDDAPRVLPVLAARPDETLLVYRMQRKDGDYVWVETTGRTVELASGERQRLIIVRDIEKRVAAEERLKASEAQYRLLAENSTDVVMAIDRQLVRTYVSPSSLEVFGYTSDELTGLKTAAAAHPEDAERQRAELRSLLDGRVERRLSLARRRHRDGRWIWVETSYRAVHDPATGAITGIVASVRDVSARKAVEEKLAAANAQLEFLSRHDGLTGLSNRRAFDETLATEVRRARRENHALALIMIDVDQFKAFNDLYGHPDGDECLRRVAGAIAASVRRPGDVVARYGGEEFVVVLPRTDEEGALTVAAKIRCAVQGLAIAHGGGESGVVTVSLGVASARPDGADGARDLLLREADRALYIAKRGGRNVAVGASAPAFGGQTPAAA